MLVALITLLFSPLPPCPLTIPLSHPAGLLLDCHWVACSPRRFLGITCLAGVPSTFTGMGLTPGSVSWDGCLQGGSESIHPFPVRGPRQGPLCLAVMVPPPPPFPSSLGSNLGVRAPSLYKPWGVGGSPGMAVAASGWEGEVYFVYE